MKGLNEYVTLAALMAISISVLIISLEFVKPLVEKSRDNFIVNEAISNIQRIVDAINQISSEGEGSRRILELRVTDGKYFFDEVSDTLNFTYVLNSDLSFSGFKDDMNITTENKVVKMFAKVKNVDFLNSYSMGKGDNRVSLEYQSFDGNVIKISITP
jgi:hypothetical protein